MEVDLTAFAPRRCLEHGLLGPFAEPLTADATTLFVDLAGFTPLTERLARHGSRGGEELSRVLRGFFGAVTDVVLDHGGDPVAYGGDALTIVFDGPRDVTVDRAVETAHVIRALAERSAGTPTSAGPVTLQARIGVARGAVTTAVARSSGRSVPVQLGAGLDRAVEAESSTVPGGILCHASASPRSAGDSAGVTLGAARTEPPDPAELERLVHPAALTRLSMGAALLETHRITTVAFTRFDPVGAEELPHFLDCVGELLEVVQAGGGEVLQVSGGDKGVVAMTVFGAPVARDDDPVRAADTMMELRRRQRGVATGIATGPVFTGLVGSERRWFSAVTGPAVNLAARLTQAGAPGQLLLESATWRGASGHLRAEGPARSIRVKGVAEPVEVRGVAGWRRTRRRRLAGGNTALIGQRTALEAIEGLLDHLGAGRGSSLVLEGEPGSGKTRLAVEATDRARTRGDTAVLVDASDHPRGRAAGLWSDCLTALGIGPATRAHDAWEQALKAALPDRLEQVPVLAGLLGVAVPPSSFSSRLPPDHAAELARTLMAAVLADAAHRRPLLLVVENVHHLDAEALDLLERLPGALTETPVGLLLTRRPDDETGEARGARSLRAVHVDDLAPDEAAILAAEVWAQLGGGIAPAWLPEAVAHGAGGNPLLVRSVARALLSEWEPGRPPPVPATDASLGALLAERIDRLPGPARQLLNLLAVAQRPVEADLVDRLLCPALDHERITEAFQQLANAGLVRLETASGGADTYRILHEALREVAYTQISHAERNRWHRSLVTELARRGADPVEVAEHVLALDDPRLGREWFERAARAARASWSVGDAIRWWRLALALLSDGERASAQVELLEVLLIGDRAPDVLDLAASSPPVGTDRVLAARWLFTEAHAAFLSGILDRSEDAATRVLALTDGIDEVRHQRALELLVRVRAERGDMPGAIDTARTQLDRAGRSDEPEVLATGHASLGMALLLAGHVEEATKHYEEAVAQAATLGDVVLEIHATSDLAGCRHAQGQYAACVELLTRARALAERIGYRRHLAYSLINEAELRSALGDQAASACAAVAVQRGLELGDRGAAANALHTWATCDLRLATSESVWRRLLDLERALGRLGYAAEAGAELALAEVRAGSTRRARAHAEEALIHLDPQEQPEAALHARLAIVLVDTGAGRRGGPPHAQALAETLTELAVDDAWGDVERAEIAVERWRVTGREEDRAVASELLRAAFSTTPSAKVRAWCGETGTVPDTRHPLLPPPVGIGRLRTGRRQFYEALSAVESLASASPRAPERTSAAL